MRTGMQVLVRARNFRIEWSGRDCYAGVSARYVGSRIAYVYSRLWQDFGFHFISMKWNACVCQNVRKHIIFVSVFDLAQWVRNLSKF